MGSKSKLRDGAIYIHCIYYTQHLIIHNLYIGVSNSGPTTWSFIQWKEQHLLVRARESQLGAFGWQLRGYLLRRCLIPQSANSAFRSTRERSRSHVLHIRKTDCVHATFFFHKKWPCHGRAKWAVSQAQDCLYWFASTQLSALYSVYIHTVRFSL